ncbi:hypothetical protein [Nocardia otitidiscaviarum]|uniref:hypothetical protein n=1 Tax=Nocardia otitidiscaviarum TaxID=1823 RepID=UPI001895363E|nr:hypothetical protein [Nocardia otitidiscaviarum]MBF6181178.1 hypothetical protein [Nocardia otitidiscaviarum]
MTAMPRARGRLDRSPRTAAVRRTGTAATDSGEVVHWPEPSPLDSWWATVMNPIRRPEPAA